MCGYADSLSICAQRLIAELLSRPQGRRAGSSTELTWAVGWFLNGYELATAKLTVSIATALDLGPPSWVRELETFASKFLLAM